MLHYNFPSFCTGEIGSSYAVPAAAKSATARWSFKAVADLFRRPRSFLTPSASSPKRFLPTALRQWRRFAQVLFVNGRRCSDKTAGGGNRDGVYFGRRRRIQNSDRHPGPEDHHGDMDLKIAGTEKGVTAIQMDVKVDAVGVKILRETFKQAKSAAGDSGNDGFGVAAAGKHLGLRARRFNDEN